MGNGQTAGYEERMLGASSMQELKNMRLAHTEFALHALSEVPNSIFVSDLHADGNKGKGALCLPIIPLPVLACFCPFISKPSTNLVNPDREFHPFPTSIAEIIPEQAYRDYIDEVNKAHRELSRDKASCCGPSIDVSTLMCACNASQRQARYEAVQRVTAKTNDRWSELGLEWVLAPYNPRRKAEVDYYTPLYWTLLMNRDKRMALEMSSPQVPQVLTRHLAKIQAKNDQKAMQEAAVKARLAQVNGTTASPTAVGIGNANAVADLERENAALRAQVAQLNAAKNSYSYAQQVPAYQMAPLHGVGATNAEGAAPTISAPYHPSYPPTVGPSPLMDSSLQIEGVPPMPSSDSMILPGQPPSQMMR